MKRRPGRAATLSLALFAAGGAAIAQETRFSLRAADEPGSKAWAQGANLSYVATDGKATWQADAVARLGWTWTRGDRIAPGAPLSAGATEWGLELGPYLHRLVGGDTPTNDRGVSARVSWYRVPSGAAVGAVLSYSGDLAASGGRTLEQGAGAPAAQYVDVDSKRLVATGSMYYQRADNWFLRLSGGAYTDDLSDSPTAGRNGRESGLHAAAQFSFYPLGLMGGALGPTTLTPLLTVKAQKQLDRSASDERVRQHYELYTVLLSFPFAFAGGQRDGLAPSLDISRSVGADLLTGRARSGITRVAFALKY